MRWIRMVEEAEKGGNGLEYRMMVRVMGRNRRGDESDGGEKGAKRRKEAKERVV